MLWVPNLDCCYCRFSAPQKNPLLGFKLILQNYCNSVVLVSPFFSHNGLSQPLKCICRFGSSFIIWNVPQCLFKNSSSLIVPSLGNYKSEKSLFRIYYLCYVQQYLTYFILESGMYYRPDNLYLP